MPEYGIGRLGTSAPQIEHSQGWACTAINDDRLQRSVAKAVRAQPVPPYTQEVSSQLRAKPGDPLPTTAIWLNRRQRQWLVRFHTLTLAEPNQFLGKPLTALNAGPVSGPTIAAAGGALASPRQAPP